MSRGQESTTARSHAGTTSVVKHMVTARDLQDVQDHLINTTTAHGVTGAVVGTTNSQTLTGKAINGPDNNLTNIAQASVTNLVSDLSNRSLTSHTHTLSGITDVTASAAELNILDGVTSSTAELNILDGVTATTANINALVGVSAVSTVQAQLDTKAPLANPTFTTGISFEGVTSDTFETLLTVVDPTADNTITLPNASGTVALINNTAHTGTTTAEALTVTGQTNLGAVYTTNSITFEGTTDNGFETTLSVTDPTADRTITFPDATGTVALTSDITAQTVQSGLKSISVSSGTGSGAVTTATTTSSSIVVATTKDSNWNVAVSSVGTNTFTLSAKTVDGTATSGSLNIYWMVIQ
jgi:hypothetical protein